MFGATLSEASQAALALLGKSGIVKDAYLAGGSALALHFGHRYSFDFDFFTHDKFDPRKLSLTLQDLGIFKEELAKGISVIGTFNGVKLSYFRYDYPLIAKVSEFLQVKIAHAHDIAAMKLVALMDRGSKRDFIDLFVLNKNGLTFEKMFSFYEKKYHSFEANRFSLVKALQYFDEEEETEMPKMIHRISWDEVKHFFTAESMRLAKKYLE